MAKKITPAKKSTALPKKSVVKKAPRKVVTAAQPLAQPTPPDKLAEVRVEPVVAIVPPHENVAAAALSVSSPDPVDISFDPALCIVGTDGLTLWGLSPRQRAIKQFSKSGLKTVLSEAEAATHNGPLILMRADAVIDTPLIAVVMKRPNFMLMSDDGARPHPVIACVRGSDFAQARKILLEETPDTDLKLLARSPSQLGNNFWKSLRKRETPYAMVITEQNRDEVEWRMFMGTYKGATDLVTKNLWPVPAFYVTRFLAPRGITPNMVTTVGLILTILTYWLFFKGQFGWGLVSAWAMTFLDTVDGKLARTTLTSSPWGNIFDHGIDLIHPPFWYVAWGLGLAHVGYVWSDQLFWTVMIAILAGYVAQRILEGIALRFLGSNIHIWRPIDTFFRQITARRNPNLVILTVFTIFQRPDLGLIAVAIWTIVCLLLHVIQIFQAYGEWRRVGSLVSWMTKS